MSETTTETTTTTKTRKTAPPTGSGTVDMTTKTQTAKRRTLHDLFHDPVAVRIARAKAHQSFMVPGAGEENALHKLRANMGDIEMVYHPGYGLIGKNKDEYFLTPSANVVVGYEADLKPVKR